MSDENQNDRLKINGIVILRRLLPKDLFFLTSYLLLLTSLLSGCIRLTGNAGYWKKNAQTEEYEGKSVNLDSNDLIYPNTKR